MTRPIVQKCDVNDVNSVLSIVKQYKTQALVIVIPKTMTGSRLEARLTKAIQSQCHCYLQFITQENADNYNAVCCALQDLMAKIN